MTAATAPRPAAAAWTRTRTPSGAWRCQHANGSVLYVSGAATEGEIQCRLADTDATIARLDRRRWSP
jgi:hypothetical protein